MSRIHLPRPHADVLAAVQRSRALTLAEGQSMTGLGEAAVQAALTRLVQLGLVVRDDATDTWRPAEVPRG